jgi:hypothetical protein
MFMASNDKIPKNNGAILNISQIIHAIMSSTVEAELAPLFINAKAAVSIQQTLEELGHPQPRTSIQTDNSTALALLTNMLLVLLTCLPTPWANLPNSFADNFNHSFVCFGSWMSYQ